MRERFPAFVFEADEVMAVLLPNPITGACAGGTQPVFRLWNMRADTNHRYTTDRDVRTAMIGRGHVPEGYGDDGVAFCAPAAAGPANGGKSERSLRKIRKGRSGPPDERRPRKCLPRSMTYA